MNQAGFSTAKIATFAKIALIAAVTALTGAHSVSVARHSVRHLPATAVLAAAGNPALDSAPNVDNGDESDCAFCEGSPSAPAIHRVAPSHSFRAPAHFRDVPYEADPETDYDASAFSARAPPAVSL